MVDGAEGCMKPVLPLEIYVDAQSAYSDITAEQVKMLAERHITHNGYENCWIEPSYEYYGGSTRETVVQT
eukprot:3878378-Pyramimonas_sp.AAC.2